LATDIDYGGREPGLGALTLASKIQYQDYKSLQQKAEADTFWISLSTSRISSKRLRACAAALKPCEGKQSCQCFKCFNDFQ
jgi:hypothetical protein